MKEHLVTFEKKVKTFHSNVDSWFLLNPCRSVS